MKILTALLATAALSISPLLQAAAKGPHRPATSARTSAYDVEFRGVSDEDLLNLLFATHDPLQTDSAPRDVVLLARGRADLEAFYAVFDSVGFFDAQIDISVIKGPKKTLLFEVNPGPVYRLSEIDIVPDTFDYASTSLPLKAGDRVFSSSIDETKQNLLLFLHEEGFVDAGVEEKLLIDTVSKTVAVTLTIDAKDKMSFGKTDIDGLKTLQKNYVTRLIPWQEGDVARPSQLKKLYERLQTSGLFSFIDVEFAKSTDKNTLPVHIQLQERKTRTVSFGVGYGSDSGFGVSAGWTHRNLYGKGERIATSLSLNERRQVASVSYRLNHFRRPDQDLVYKLFAEKEKTDAYLEKSASFGPTIERTINEETDISFGGRLYYLHSSESLRDGTWWFLNPTYTVLWQHADDRMKPRRGLLVHCLTNPYLNLNKNSSSAGSFLRNEVELTHFCPLSTNIVAKNSVLLGSIFAPSLIKVPAPLRFYGGSSQFMRGYTYQTVSELSSTDEHTPIGGRSINAFSFEVLFHYSQSAAVSTFFDLGNTYESRLPRFSNMLSSCGVGWRCETPVGPLKIDVAFPLDKRPSIDNTVHFYASLSQTF